MTKTPYRIHFRQGEFELDVEGDRAFVESYVAAFIAGAPAMAPEKGAPRGTRPGRKPAAESARRPSRRGGAAVTVDEAALKAFMKGRKPASNKARYLTYMGFLKTQGQTSVNDPMVRACFAADGLPVPPTGRQNFSILRGDGLVKSGAGRGMWTLTPEGEAEVLGRPTRKAAPPAKKASRAKVRKAAAPAAKKAAAKKPAAKKAAAAKKPAVKKAAAAPKKVAAKKVSAASPKKALPKKVVKKAARRLPVRSASKAEPEESFIEVIPPDAMAE